MQMTDDCMNPLFHFSGSIDVIGSFAPTNRKCLNIRACFFLCVCERVCVCACVRVCVRVYMFVFACACVQAR